MSVSREGTLRVGVGRQLNFIQNREEVHMVPPVHMFSQSPDSWSTVSPPWFDPRADGCFGDWFFPVSVTLSHRVTEHS